MGRPSDRSKRVPSSQSIGLEYPSDRIDVPCQYPDDNITKDKKRLWYHSPWVSEIIRYGGAVGVIGRCARKEPGDHPSQSHHGDPDGQIDDRERHCEPPQYIPRSRRRENDEYRQNNKPNATCGPAQSGRETKAAFQYPILSQAGILHTGLGCLSDSLRSDHRRHRRQAAQDRSCNSEPYSAQATIRSTQSRIRIHSPTSGRNHGRPA